jgi:hypothetical protein
LKEEHTSIAAAGDAGVVTVLVGTVLVCVA